MAITLTTVDTGLVGSTWELQRPQGVDTGVVVSYASGTGLVTVPDLSLTAGDYWLEHTLTNGGACTSITTEQFTAYELAVSAALSGSETNCQTIVATPSGGTGNYTYTYKKDDPDIGATVYGPTTDNTYDPDTEGSPTQTPGSTNEYYIILTDTESGCTATDMISRTACAYSQDKVLNKATGLLNFTGQPANGETVTLDAKVYTFQTTLTDVDGNVEIGATLVDSIDNLVSAVTLGSGAGTKYANSMTIHPTVTALDDSASNRMMVIAKASGTGAESIATTETIANATFVDATLLILPIGDGVSPSRTIGVYMEFTCGGTNMRVNIEFAETGGGEGNFSFDYDVDYDCGQKVQYFPAGSVTNGTYDVTVTATNDATQQTTVVKTIVIS